MGSSTQHGEVGISVSKLSETPQDAVLRFEVHDTGIGIPPEKQHLLFKAFTQVDASTTRHYGGTGFGLSIARDLVQAMHGTIAVSSSPGVGSTFWFTLKLAKQIETGKPASERFASMYGTKVLIVDDNATSRQILERQVSSWGMKPSTAGSAEEALAALHAAAQTAPFELALLDVMMPDIDGIDLARRISAEPSLPKPIVVFVSSVGARSDFIARTAGMNVGGWLMKPVPESVLYNTLLKALSGAPAGSSLRERGETAADVTTHRFRLPAGKALRTLLAEDNPLNQKVARLQLGKLGIQTEVAANGREAVQLATRSPYDLIFMDCQMPEMDGYQATREIRQREGTSHHAIIVAMTAHALPGDREKCLEAGMDSYISKPVTQEALEATLAEIFAAPPQPVRASGTTEPPAACPSDGAKDSVAANTRAPDGAALAASHNGSATAETPSARLHRRLEDVCKPETIEEFRSEGEGLLEDLIALFNSEVSEGLEELAHALQAGDSETVARVAHNMKGNAGSFGATRMFDMAAAIDQAARVKALDKVTALFPAFRTECDQVRSVLNAQVELKS
jgi:two-component system sensor histidine kinase/response regulator